MIRTGLAGRGGRPRGTTAAISGRGGEVAEQRRTKRRRRDGDELEQGRAAPPPLLRRTDDEGSSGDVTYARLKQAIITGELEPGAALVELNLAEWCGVSRTPVREALTRLEQDGLVVRGERGLMVRMRRPEEILDLYETRIVLEATAAAVAAERHTRFDRLRLERHLRDMESEPPPDPATRAEANRSFHREIWLASGNESLTDLLERLNLHLGRYPETTLSYPGRWESALREHRELAEYIFARDSERASDAARRHFTAARDIRIALWEDQSDDVGVRSSAH
jgi:DNA-binding GntR family transcriptional regulator